MCVHTGAFDVAQWTCRKMVLGMSSYGLLCLFSNTCEDRYCLFASC